MRQRVIRVVLEDRRGRNGEGIVLAIGDELDGAGHARLDGTCRFVDIDGDDRLELAGRAWDGQDAGKSARNRRSGSKVGVTNPFSSLGCVKRVKVLLIDSRTDVEWARGDNGDEHLVGGDDSSFTELGRRRGGATTGRARTGRSRRDRRPGRAR